MIFSPTHHRPYAFQAAVLGYKGKTSQFLFLFARKCCRLFVLRGGGPCLNKLLYGICMIMMRSRNWDRDKAGKDPPRAPFFAALFHMMAAPGCLCDIYIIKSESFAVQRLEVISFSSALKF